MNKSDRWPRPLPAGNINYPEMDPVRIEELKKRVMAAIQNALKFGVMDNALNEDVVENTGYKRTI